LAAVAVTGFTRRAAFSQRAVFPGTPFHQYSRCLPDYLRGLAKKAVLKRDSEIAKLVSPAAVEARQKWVRATLWKLIGGMPERTALNARTTGSFEREGYRIEKIIYESRPGLFVSANLYIPKTGREPFPAVLFQSGHYEEGKTFPNYQRCCQALAQLGFVVLAFDPMGQGERVAYLRSSGTRSRLSDVDSEHTTPGKQMLLYGDTATRFQLWDAMRSLDYLTSLPMVDAKRVGSTGHSGGGTLTMLLAATDDRLAVAAPCMGNIENVAALPFLPPGSTDDAEQNFVYSGPVGFDRWDLFYPFAPKPMLIWPSDRDFYATYSPQYVTNAWQEFHKLKATYSLLGKADHLNHLSWADTPLPHSLAYDSRLLIYNWFSRWLKNEKTPVREEPPVKPEPVSLLQATESGSVVRSLGSATPFSLNQARKVKRTPMALDALIGASRPAAAASAKILARAQSGKVRVQALEVASDPGVWLPVWILTAENAPKNKPVLLVLDPSEAEQLWFQPDADAVLGPGSPVVCAADVRGVGALRPEYSGGAPGYAASHEQEENYAWGSLILGKPLVGQRVTDILAITAALRKIPAMAGSPIRIAASGKLTVPALFAAALDSGIEGLYLSGGLISFQDVVDSERYDHPFTNFVPGLLNHTDLPEVAASIAPRRIVLAGPVSGKGTAMQVEAAQAIYGGGNVTVGPRADWSAARLLAYAAG
jgi:dienelactone hydrolase